MCKLDFDVDQNNCSSSVKIKPGICFYLIYQTNYKMEDTTVLDSGDYGSATKEIKLTNESIAYLKETAKWGTFLAIIGFISIGIMLLAGIGVALFMSSASLPGMEAIGGMGALAVMYIVIAAIYIYPTLKLYQFATKCKKSIVQSSTDLMTEALANLKSCFKFIGILMLITLVIYGLLIVFGSVFASLF